MKASLFKGGAITSAVFTAFCWQLPLTLASLGLGSFTFAVWLAEYRWIFTGLTFVFLGFAFYKTYKDRHAASKWNFRMLYGATALSMGLIMYTLLFK